MATGNFPAMLRVTGPAGLAWARILLVQEILLSLFFIAGTHGVFGDLRRPATTDFASFYAAGTLAREGTPALAYDQIAHWHAEERTATAGAGYVFFFYPPVFLMLCAALARLPYLAAFILFQFGSLGLFLCVIGRILGGARRPIPAATWLVLVLAYPPVLLCLGHGQNSFLTASLLGSATLLLDQRPISAGSMIGAICYKPHFGLLMPFALLARREFAAFWAASAMAAGLVALSIAWFGVGTWQAYLDAFRASPAIYQSGRVAFIAFVTPFGAARLVGLPPGAAYAIQAAATLACIFIVLRVWRSTSARPARAAALIAATLIAVPLALFYDLAILAIAIAWLVRDGKLTVWDKRALVAIYPVTLVQISVADALAVPLSVLPAAIVLWVAARQAGSAFFFAKKKQKTLIN